MPSLNLVRFMRRLSASETARSAAAETLRDYPLRLKLNIAAERVAPILYAAHAEMSRYAPVPWAELDHQVRDRWRERAATALRTL